MHKRIKYLLNEATSGHEQETDRSKVMTVSDREMETFAELIVWEAIGVCRVDVDALTSPFLPEYEKGIVEGYRRANENLRFLFGVEE